MKLVIFTESHLVYQETNQLVFHEDSQFYRMTLSVLGNQPVS